MDPENHIFLQYDLSMEFHEIFWVDSNWNKKEDSNQIVIHILDVRNCKTLKVHMPSISLFSQCEEKCKTKGMNNVNSIISRVLSKEWYGIAEFNVPLDTV